MATEKQNLNDEIDNLNKNIEISKKKLEDCEKNSKENDLIKQQFYDNGVKLQEEIDKLNKQIKQNEEIFQTNIRKKLMNFKKFYKKKKHLKLVETLQNELQELKKQKKIL